MSGIVGLVNRDAPADPALLARMTEAMAFRGPDAIRTHVAGPVGLGHALLQVSDDVRADVQPCSLDGEVWITADARIDDRPRLRRELRDTGRDVADDAPDVELVLHGYHAWGAAVVEHLLGDFVFAIWDGRSRTLLCARDQIGTKPFFYADRPSGIVFGNTLPSVRLHPDVSDRLNELAIADFLVFGYNAELDTTAFADVRRLPAAHILLWTPTGLTLRRYWTMPIREPVYFRDEREYVERFSALLETAVADRIRTSRLAVSMSGGLDSSSLATIAHGQMAQQGRAEGLRVWTTVSDKGGDQERYYATLVAQRLGLPITYQVAEQYPPFSIEPHRMMWPPEPRSLFGAARQFERLSQVSAHARVIFTGQGGDVVLHPSASHLAHAARRLDLLRLVRDVWRHRRQYGRLPRLGVRTRLRQRYGRRRDVPVDLPGWLNPDLVARLDLRARVAQVVNRRPTPVDHHRPEAYRLVGGEQWPRLFEGYGADVTGFPIEFRHPLFDLRLLDFALTVPTMPWCTDKALLREAMRGRLPEEVRLRRKTPLATNPIPEMVAALRAVQPELSFTASLHSFTSSTGILPAQLENAGIPEYRRSVRPFFLQLWMHGANRHEQE